MGQKGPGHVAAGKLETDFTFPPPRLFPPPTVHGTKSEPHTCGKLRPSCESSAVAVSCILNSILGQGMSNLWVFGNSRTQIIHQEDLGRQLWPTQHYLMDLVWLILTVKKQLQKYSLLSVHRQKQTFSNEQFYDKTRAEITTHYIHDQQEKKHFIHLISFNLSHHN